MQNKRAMCVMMAVAILGPGHLCFAAMNLAVFNFQMKSDTPDWKWLEKGLADRITTDFTQGRGLSVVARDEMQVLAQKMNWVPEMATTNAKGMGQVKTQLKVETLVTGVYEVAGSQIRIMGQIVEVGSRKEVARKEITGKAEEVLELQRRLSAELLSVVVNKPAAQILPQLPVWTRSLPAAKALYEGMDLYDQGRYAEGWLKFRQASKADPQYMEAQYFVGKMYYFMDRYEHARRVLEKFVYLDSVHPRLMDAVVEYLHTYEKLDTPNGTLLALYADFARRYPEIRFRPSPLIVRTSSAWLAEKTMLLQERMGRWRDAAFTAAGPARENGPIVGCSCLWSLLNNNALTGATFSPTELPGMVRSCMMERNTVFLTDGSRQATVDIIRPDPNVSRLSGASKTEHWCLVAPSGCVFKSVRLLPNLATDRGVVTVSACTDLWGNVADSEVAAAQVRKSGFLLANIPRTGYLRGSMKVAVEPPEKEVDLAWNGLRATVELESVGAHGALEVVYANTANVRVDIDGRMGRIGTGLIGLVPPGRHTARIYPTSAEAPFGESTAEVTVEAERTTPLTVTLPWKPDSPWASWKEPVLVGSEYTGHNLELDISQAGPPAIQMDGETIRLVWSHGGDLWWSASTDGQTFSRPKRLGLPVSTAWKECHPAILRDESGRFMLVLQSNRDARHVSYPYVCWSRDFTHWSAPAKMLDIAVRIHHQVFQDERGRLIALYFKNMGDGSFNSETVASRDAYRWEQLGSLCTIPKGQDGGWAAVQKRDDGTFEMFCATRRVHDPRHPYPVPPGTIVTIRRYLSGDGATWSAGEKVGEFEYEPARKNPDTKHSLWAVHVGGRSVLCLFSIRRADGVPELQLFRQKGGGEWETSHILPAVQHVDASFAWHPKWGYVIASLVPEDRGGYPHPASGPYLMRGPSLEPFFSSGPAEGGIRCEP